MHLAEDFDIFVAIVDSGSISEAARILNIPRATLSRQLGRLEERLGTRLINRSTRHHILTPAGEALYPKARQLLEGAQAAVDAIERLDGVPRGKLRISSAPLDSALIGLLVSRYLQTYPKVQIELRTSTQHINLVTEQIDIAIRGGIIRDPNLIARRLLNTSMITVANQTYLDAHGTPTTPSELGQHTCLRGFLKGVRPIQTWPLRNGDKIDITGPFVSNDLMAIYHATLNGLGIAMLPHSLVASDLKQGNLVHILEDDVGVNVSLSLVWVERKFIDPKVRAFIDLASEVFSTQHPTPSKEKASGGHHLTL